MLLVPDDGIVAHEPNIPRAQAQGTATLARLMTFKWGLHATN